MRRALLGLAACALSLSLAAGAADAHGPAARAHAAYCEQHGVRFSGGYYYAGRHHDHWSCRVWDAGCGRYHYYDPHLRCWYYWYAPGSCYYPVSYCP
jgi:hypothetical protein